MQTKRLHILCYCKYLLLQLIVTQMLRKNAEFFQNVPIILILIFKNLTIVIVIVDN